MFKHFNLMEKKTPEYVCIFDMLLPLVHLPKDKSKVMGRHMKVVSFPTLFRYLYCDTQIEIEISLLGFGLKLYLRSIINE
jgi:hypothetical protein